MSMSPTPVLKPFVFLVFTISVLRNPAVYKAERAYGSDSFFLYIFFLILFFDLYRYQNTDFQGFLHGSNYMEIIVVPPTHPAFILDIPGVSVEGPLPIFKVVGLEVIFSSPRFPQLLLLYHLLSLAALRCPLFVPSLEDSFFPPCGGTGDLPEPNMALLVLVPLISGKKAHPNNRMLGNLLCILHWDWRCWLSRLGTPSSLLRI